MNPSTAFGWLAWPALSAASALPAVLWGLSALMLGVALVLTVPVLVLGVQAMASLRAGRGPRQGGAKPAAQPEPSAASRPRVAIVMPAHNEAAGITPAIAALLVQLHPGDRLLVVADNCSDDTARIAANAGAEVIERSDVQRRGKGYALDFGVRHLERSVVPDIVVIVDADCEVHPGALDRLVEQCLATGRPTQAMYLMQAPMQAPLKTRLAQFAWVVKNQVRPLGFHRLGLPCPLMGTGMAFPWALIRSAPLATGHIVEDMQLGLDLANRGAAPGFCPEALVTSVFPLSVEGAVAQRTRWEHGHLSIIATHGPRMLWRALTTRNAGLAGMALDLAVPPLASLVLLLVAGWALSGALVVAGGAALPLVILSGALIVLTAAIVAAWARFGRRIVSLAELRSVPVYVLAKLPIYAKLFTHRQLEWVRTKRDDRSE